MSRLLRQAAAAIVVLVGLSHGVWAEVLPADARNLQRIGIFRNVTGSTQASMTAYILQDNNNDANVLVGSPLGGESSLGLDVTTTTSADQGTFIGCQLDDSVIDDQLVRVVMGGPALCLWAGSTDNTNTRMATVGTTTVAGQLGSGTLAGLSMSLSLQDSGDTVGTTAGEINGRNDGERRWIWVSPDNN